MSMLLLKTLLLLCASYTAVCATSDWITWTNTSEHGCTDYQETSGVFPRVYRIEITQQSNLADCRVKCSRTEVCGGFVFDRKDRCVMYNINDGVIRDHLDETWYGADSNRTWYSKTCAYVMPRGTDLECNTFETPYKEGVYINPINPVPELSEAHPELFPTVNLTHTAAIPALAANQCHQWCLLYRGCRSVVYRRDYPDTDDFRDSDEGWVTGRCAIYTATIRDPQVTYLHVLRNKELSRAYTTYDRYCQNGTAYRQPAATSKDGGGGTSSGMERARFTMFSFILTIMCMLNN